MRVLRGVLIFSVFICFIFLTACVIGNKSIETIDTGKFIKNSVYKNETFGFSLTYPEGSIFANANPESGFVTRFFLPGGKTLGGDQENVGIYVADLNNRVSIDDRLEILKNTMAQPGAVDIQEVTFGGQKAYRIILTTDYSARKGTQELIYSTVRGGVVYELNYFPVVEESLSTVANIAKSFQFIQ